MAWCFAKTYTEVLDLVENLIIESEVIAGNYIDASILLDLPVCKTESLGLAEELSLGELSAPVCLCRLLQVTVDSHARETEDRSVIETRIRILKLCRRSAMGGTCD